MSSARLSTQRLLPAREVPAAKRRRVGGTKHRLRQRGVGELLDLAVEIFLRRFGTFVGYSIVILFPFHIGAELFYDAVPRSQDFVFAASAGVIGFFLISWGIARVFVVSLVGAELMGREPQISEALRSTFGRLPALTFLIGFTWTAAALGTCACILPVFLAVWLFEPSVSAFALDGKQPMRGLGFPSAMRAIRSGPALASGLSSFLRWLGCTVSSVLFVLPFLLRFHDDLGFREAVEGHFSPLSADVLLALTGTFLLAIGLAFRSVVATVFYVDLRVRKEGLDIRASLMERIAARERKVSSV